MTTLKPPPLRVIDTADILRFLADTMDGKTTAQDEYVLDMDSTIDVIQAVNQAWDAADIRKTEPPQPPAAERLIADEQRIAEFDARMNLSREGA